MRSRIIAVFGACAIIVSACGSSATPGSPSASFAPPDQAVVEAFKAKGVEDPMATILAMTKVSVVSADDHSAHILATLPTGETADTTITITPNPSGDPARIQTTSARTSDGVRFTLAYHVGPGTATTDLPRVIAPRSVDAARARLVVARMPEPETVTVADSSGLDVLVETFWKKAQEQTFDRYVQYLEDRHGGQYGAIVQYLKLLGSIFDATSLRDKYENLGKRIDAVEKCARSPTSRLTIDAYQEDPGAKTRILEEIEATRLEIKSNVAITYLGMLNETAADLIKAAPWLGTLIGPGTAWAAGKLDEVNEQYVAELERSISKCKEEETPEPSLQSGSPSQGPTSPPRSTETDQPRASSAGPLPPGAIRLEGVLTGAVSIPVDGSLGPYTSYRGKATVEVVVIAPYGLDRRIGNESGRISYSGVVAGDCVGSGAGEGVMGTSFGPDSSTRIDRLDGTYITRSQFSVNDGPVGMVGGPQEHGLVLVVVVSVEDPIDATCGVIFGPAEKALFSVGETNGMTTCRGSAPYASGFILKKTGTGSYVGSCHEDLSGGGAIDWSGEIHQVSP